MMKQQGVALLLSLTPYPNPFLPFPKTTKLQNPKKPTKIKLTLTTTKNETPLTGREKRQLRNERRENKPTNNWKDEVETRLIKKPKKRYASWTEELNLDNLALLGPQWWGVRVSRVTGNECADRMARALVRNFPDIDFKVYIPAVQIKKKLKNGTLSVKPKPLFPGCVFLRCIMNKEVHDAIRECDGIGGFIGSKVGNTKKQINKPRPVDEEDLKAIYKQAKEEQELADQAFAAEEQQAEEAAALASQKLVEESPQVSKDVKQSNTVKKPGRGRKSAKQPIVEKYTFLKPGSTVQVATGAFAGFSGTLKKLDDKTGLATVGFTLFGKETLADIHADEFLAETT